MPDPIKHCPTCSSPVTQNVHGEIEYTRTAPKIKPLVWLGGGDRYHAGEYIIQRVSCLHGEAWNLWRAYGKYLLCRYEGRSPLDNAKRGANEHRVDNILSALGGDW